MIQDEDFLIRQIKSIAKGLGKFMGKEQIKEILNFTEDEQGLLADDEFETIIVMTKIETIIYNAQMSFSDLSNELDIEIDRLRNLMNNKEYASANELDQMNAFGLVHQDHL